MSAIEKAAEWSSTLKLDNIPQAVRKVARDCFVDTLGVALAGASRTVVGKLRALAERSYREGDATVFAGKSRMTAPAAALINGAAAHALDFDDNCYAGFVHGSAVIMPAALAVAEAENVSGAELVTAFVAGCEVEFAAGDAATPHLYEKGWWNTGVLGPIGAATAAARIMKLDAQKTGYAIGLAVAGTGGAKACFGTDGKAALCGRTAEAGVVAALMAREGCSGPLNAFEDSRGFANLLNDKIFLSECFEQFGRDWRSLKPGVDFKRVPVCLSAHAALDAVMDIMAAHHIAVADIENIVCDVGPVVTANLVYDDPKTPQQAQFSMPFTIGCMLVKGDISLADLSQAVVDDPKVRTAMQRVKSVTTGRWKAGSEIAQRYPEGAHVTVTTRDDRTYEHFNGFARGTTARPLSDEEIASKFMSCAAKPLGEQGARGLLAKVRSLETLPSARSLFRA
ncbi:MAG: MmgE/PrpD family protein [Xanthobacteraceae bacterium]